MLLRRNRRFFEPIAAAARATVEAARLTAELFDRYPESGDRLAAIQAAEREGDRLLAELHERLSTTFVTPIHRSDLIAIATAIDDVTDALQDAASTLHLHAVRYVPEQARAQARLALAACERLADAAERLWRFPDLTTELDDIYALEDQADDVLRDALARLFASGAEPLDVVRTKSVHDALERVLDACKTAAQRIESTALAYR